MSDQQMAELYERLNGARSKRATAERIFLRGWNAAIDFAIKQLSLVDDDPVENVEKKPESAHG